jgi:hypothetical protein
MKRTGLLLALLTMLQPAAAAADVSEADMVKCAGIVADAERLACYDSLAGRIAAAAAVVEQRQAEAAAAKRKADAEAAAAAARAAEEAAARKREAFGAETTAKRDMLSEDKLDELSGRVTDYYTDRYGKYVLVLDNGQIWKQVDGKLLIPREGDEVIVERAALGSYNMKILRQKRSVKAKRVR